MSLQWTFVATFLYTEIALLALFLLPFISASRWSKIFKSRLMTSLGSYAYIYLNLFLVVLGFLLYDAIMEFRKYSIDTTEIEITSGSRTSDTIHMKLFRAQRNFYIVLFALVLFMALRRMVRMFIENATLTANNEALGKQAASASAAAKQFMEDKDNKQNTKTEEQAADKDELDKLRKRIMDLEAELVKSQTDTDTMKKQATSTIQEYDNLLTEHSKLQAELESIKGDGMSKKDA